MSNSFFKNQNIKEQELYIKLLKTLGSLSNLFSTSLNPYLHYRVMENVFCKAFGANNLSRSDISVDAVKDNMGIGLKTFIETNHMSFQKIAEFNKKSSLLRNKNDYDLIFQVSVMRNKRIETTKSMVGFQDLIYHYITRSNNKMSIYEEHMDSIDLDTISINNTTNTTIHFKDKNNYYNFNKSKSTLFKRFVTRSNNKVCEFKVNILDDPYDFLLLCKEKKDFIYSSIKQTNNIIDYIILPLYSSKSKDKKVHEKSGLNMWNAAGRPRDENEVYIPIPSWIHTKKRGFFNYNTKDNKTNPFNVKLPNGDVILMKVAQEGGKALMSNPNSALGKWILRDVLQIEPRNIVTREDLDAIGIDSVKLSKSNDLYYLDFLKSGSYEDFEESFN